MNNLAKFSALGLGFILIWFAFGMIGLKIALGIWGVLIMINILFFKEEK